MTRQQWTPLLLLLAVLGVLLIAVLQQANLVGGGTTYSCDELLSQLSTETERQLALDTAACR